MIHVFFRCGSVGQGCKDAVLIKTPAKNNNIKARMEIYTLYLEIIISWGKIFTIDAKVAPAPTATKIAGKAQHINVDDDASKARNPNLFDSLLLSTIYNIFLIITLVAVWPFDKNIFLISSMSISFEFEYAMSTFPVSRFTSTFFTALSS